MQLDKVDMYRNVFFFRMIIKLVNDQMVHMHTASLINYVVHVAYIQKQKMCFIDAYGMSSDVGKSTCSLFGQSSVKTLFMEHHVALTSISFTKLTCSG